MSARTHAPGRPIRGRLLAYCHRFRAAGWAVSDIAWLFDLEPAPLGAALQRRASL